MTTEDLPVDLPSTDAVVGNADTSEGSEDQPEATETATDPVFDALAQLASSNHPNAWVEQTREDAGPDFDSMSAKELKTFAAENLGMIVPANWGKAKTLELIQTCIQAAAVVPPEPDYEPASPRG